MDWKYIMIYYLSTPLIMVFVTTLTHLLALSGQNKGINLPNLVSGMIGNTFGWKFLGALFVWAWLWLIFTKEEVKGPITLQSSIPTYKGRSFVYYIATVIAYLCCELSWPGLSAQIYQNMPQIVGCCNIIAYILATYMFMLPSSEPEVEENTKIYTFYSGKNMNPHLFGVDLKQLITCRVGSMGWQVLILAFYIASLQANGFNFPTLVTFLIPSIYMTKCFYWEECYFHSLDMAFDATGFYLIFGSLVWITSFYTFNSYYLVSQVPVISDFAALVLLIIGIIGIVINGYADIQRLKFRLAKDGKYNICGKPATFIRAKYKDTKGREKSLLLLTSGLWGMVRHMNYFGEVLHTLCWSLTGYGLGYKPFLFLTCLIFVLSQRFYRDEQKCREKYGKYWEEYSKVVPYKVIPKVF